MYEFIHYQVKDVMTPDPVSIGPDSTLSLAEAIFEKHDFNGLPVVDHAKQFMGFVTKLDLLKAFQFRPENKVPHYEEIVGRKASEVMTKTPHTFLSDAPLTRVLEKMTETRSKSFPVLDGDRLVGIIAREDILKALRKAASGEPPVRLRFPDEHDAAHSTSN